MTDELLSLTIAESFGWKWFIFAGKSFLVSPQMSEVYESSPGLGWKQGRIEGTEMKLRECFTGAQHQDSPNYVTDPAMTVMLMERLLKLDWLIGFIQENPMTGRAVFNLVPPPGFPDIDNPILGRAIAEAYAKAKGLC